MGLVAESLLATTGLVIPPERSHVILSRTVAKDWTKGALAVLDQRKQHPIRVNPVGKTYFERLSRPPNYPAYIETLTPLIGMAEAGSYQLAHQAARQLLLDRYPHNDIETLFGVTKLPLDREAEAQWLLEASFVEDQRIVKDLGAAALLTETMDVFTATFPLLYAEMRRAIRRELGLRRETWSPPDWLESTLYTFLRLPAEPSELPPPADEAQETKGELDIESLDTPGQKAMKAG